MNKVIAKVATESVVPGGYGDADFIMLGHFSLLTFRLLDPSEKISEIGNRLLEQGNESDAQDLCLFDMDNTPSKIIENMLNPNALLEKGMELPLIVMVTIEDRPDSLSELANYPSQEQTKKALADHLQKYIAFFDEYLSSVVNLDVGMRVKMAPFYTLGCVDAVLLFRTNCFCAVHEFTKWLYRERRMLTSYSLYGFTKWFYAKEERDRNRFLDALVDTDKIRMLFRVRYKQNCDQEKVVQEIKGALTKRDISFSRVTLAGDHHDLFIIKSRARELFREFFLPGGKLNFFDTFIGSNIENMRTTICFEDPLYLQGVDFLDVTNSPDEEQATPPDRKYSWLNHLRRFVIAIFAQQSAATPHYTGLTKAQNPSRSMQNFPSQKNVTGYIGELELYESLDTKFKEILACWESCLERCVDNDLKELAKSIAPYSQSVDFVFRQHTAFFRALRRRADVNPAMLYMLDRSLGVLHAILIQYIERIKTEFGLTGRDPRLVGIVDLHKSTLGEVQNYVEILGNHIRNMIHMQRGFLEERGLFQNSITATAKISLGYFSYINALCEKFRSLDGSGAAITDIACFVLLSTMPVAVDAAERFANLQHIQQEDKEGTLHALITVNISQHSAFAFKRVKHVLCHEVLHFTGDRKRELRAEAIMESLCIWLCDILLPQYDLEYVDDEEMKAVLDRFARDTRMERESARKRRLNTLKDKLHPLVCEYILSKFDNQLDWAHLYFLRLALTEFFSALLETLDEQEVQTPHAEPDYQAFLLMLVNEVADQKQDFLNCFSEWYAGQPHRDDGVYEQLARFFVLALADSRAGLLSGAVTTINQRLFFARSGRKSPALRWHHFYIKEDGKLQKKAESVATDKGTAYPLDDKKQVSVSVYNMVNSVCNGISEAFSDAGMITLHKLTWEQYLEVLASTHFGDWATLLRTWIVWKTCYPEIVSFPFSGAYLHTESYLIYTQPLLDYMNNTLEPFRSLREDPFFHPKGSEEDEFLSLYLGYERLREEALSQ